MSQAQRFLCEAIELAQTNMEHGGRPFGAVVVKDSEVVALSLIHISLMVPAIGVLGSVLLLGERPTPTDWLGLCLVIAASGAILIPARRA